MYMICLDLKDALWQILCSKLQICLTVARPIAVEYIPKQLTVCASLTICKNTEETPQPRVDSDVLGICIIYPKNLMVLLNSLCNYCLVYIFNPTDYNDISVSNILALSLTAHVTRNLSILNTAWFCVYLFARVVVHE